MGDRAGWAWALCSAAVVGGIGVVRYLNHHSGAFDLGVFDQAVWQLAHGRTNVSLIERSIFADHLSPVLLLLAPLYWISASAIWLLAVQAVAIGSTVLPVRALAREVGASVGVATALVLGSAPLLAAGMFDFHPSTLAVPFLALAALAVVRDDTRLLLVAALAILVCRADLGWIVASLVIVAGPRTRWWCLGLGLGGAALGAIVPELAGNPGAWEAYYSHLGTGPVDAALHPWRVVEGLVGRDSVRVLVSWLIPVGALTLLRPRWGLALLAAGVPVLLSGWEGSSLPWFHYGAPYVPLVVAGALSAIGTSSERSGPPRELLRVAALAGMGAGLLLISPLSPRAPGSLQVWNVLAEDPDRDVDEALEAIDERAAVSATSTVLAQAMHREGAYLYPLPFAEPIHTYPPGLAPPPSADTVATIDVVILLEEQVEAGDHEDLPADFRVVARPRGFVVFSRV